MESSVSLLKKMPESELKHWGTTEKAGAVPCDLPAGEEEQCSTAGPGEVKGASDSGNASSSKQSLSPDDYSVLEQKTGLTNTLASRFSDIEVMRFSIVLVTMAFLLSFAIFGPGLMESWLHALADFTSK